MSTATVETTAPVATAVNLDTSLATPAPIQGATTLQAGEIQVATGASALIAALGVLIATLRPSLMPAYTVIAPSAISFIAAAAAFAHVIRDRGVTKALSQERVALIHALASASDPAVLSRLTALESALKSVPAASRRGVAATT